MNKENDSKPEETAVEPPIELLLPDPVPSCDPGVSAVIQAEQKKYAAINAAKRTRVKRGHPPAEEDECQDLVNNPLNRYGLCSNGSAWKAANQLFRSHVYMSTGAAWSIAENLVIWVSRRFTEVRDHPDMNRFSAHRIAIDGIDKRRPFEMMSLGGVKYALSPAHNALVFQDHPYWETIGLKFREGNLPELGHCRYVEVDCRETLRAKARVPLLYLIDGNFKETVVPAANDRMRRAIYRIFKAKEIAEEFPDLARHVDCPYTELALSEDDKEKVAEPWSPGEPVADTETDALQTESTDTETGTLQ